MERVMNIITIPRHGVPDSLEGINEALEGVTLKMLAAGETIHVRTQNNDYRILLLDPETSRALVQGGPFFAEPTEATVSGSTFGGSMIKLGWIGPGLCMEISAHGHLITTSPVASLHVGRVK